MYFGKGRISISLIFKTCLNYPNIISFPNSSCDGFSTNYISLALLTAHRLLISLMRHLILNLNFGRAHKTKTKQRKINLFNLNFNALFLLVNNVNFNILSFIKPAWVPIRNTIFNYSFLNVNIGFYFYFYFFKKKLGRRQFKTLCSYSTTIFCCSKLN